MHVAGIYLSIALPYTQLLYYIKDYKLNDP